jgi:hypothetical protein
MKRQKPGHKSPPPNTTLALRSKNHTSRARVHISTARTRSNTARWRAAFLRSLRQRPDVKHACSVAKIDRATAYRHRREDDEFDAAWTDAIAGSVDELETKAFELAAKGDTNLITFLLRCHKPEVYRDIQKHEVGLLGGIVLLPAKQSGPE